MQAHPADECRSHALHCVDIAERAPTAEDRSQFSAFAEAWYKLADEIDYSERLIDFIDGLAAHGSSNEDSDRAGFAAGVQSVIRLAATVVAIPNRFIADRFNGSENYNGS